MRPLPFVRLLPCAGALALLVPGCFTDAPPLTSADAGDEEGDDDDGSSSAGGDDASSMSAGDDDDGATSNGDGSMSSSATTPTDSSDDDGDSTTDPSDTSDDDTSQPCGELGQACCASDRCNRGQCHDGSCVAFRGAYADTLPCEECVANDHLGTLSGCDCEGFPASSPFTVFTDTCMPDEPHVDANVFFCDADLGMNTSDSDWGGAYMVAGNAVCGDVADLCTVPNAHTGGCNCDDTMDEILVHLQGPCSGGGGLSDYELHLCSSNAVAPITFGGAFQLLDGGACANGNPRAAMACDCPVGFAQQWLRIISSATTYGSTLVFCVGSP